MASIELSEGEIRALKPSHVCSFPSNEPHPKSADFEAYTRNYLATRWPWPSESAKQRFLDMEIETILGIWLPCAKDCLVEAGCLWLTVYFLIDDLMEEVSDAGQSFQRILPLTLGTAQPREGDPFEEAIYDIHARCRAVGDQSDLALFNEMSHINIEWIKYVLKQSKEALKGSKPVEYDTFEDFMTDRKNEVAGHVGLPVLRWLCNIAIPKDVHAHPSVKHMESILITHATLVNDIYSLRKELKELAKKKRANVKTTGTNSLIYLSERFGYGLPAAVKEVEGRLVGLERDFLEAAEKAKLAIGLSFGQQGQEVIEKYTEAIKIFMVGNIEWHATAGRYNNLNLY